MGQILLPGAEVQYCPSDLNCDDTHGRAQACLGGRDSVKALFSLKKNKKAAKSLPGSTSTAWLLPDSGKATRNPPRASSRDTEA